MRALRPWLAVSLVACAPGAALEGAAPPPAPAAPGPHAPSAPAPDAAPAPPAHAAATDVLHGVTVADPHRWLEGWDDEVKAWTAAQKQRAAAAIGAIPGGERVRARVRELRMATARTFDVKARGKKVFAQRLAPPRQQPDLVVFASADDRAPRVLVDATSVDASGKTAIDFYEPSADGRFVALVRSRAGTERGDVHVVEVASGKELGDVVPNVQMPGPGGAVAWRPDGKGFYYSHHGCKGDPAPDREHFCTTVYEHALGRPVTEDREVLAEGFPRTAEVHFDVSADGRYVAAQIQRGDGRDYAYWVIGPKGGAWKAVAPFGAGVYHAAFGAKGALYLATSAGAPRGRVVVTSADAPDLARAKTVVAESDGAIADVVAAGDVLFVSEQVGLPMRLRVVSAGGKELARAALPPYASVAGLEATGPGEVGAMVQTYDAPPAWVRVDAKGRVTRTPLGAATAVDVRDVEVIEESCGEVDGGRIDLHVLQRKGTPREGVRPTILTGYGGFSIARAPSFNPLLRMHLDAGVTVAIAGLRGGGEHGPGWHAGGMLRHKQNVFDDLGACAERLVARKVTDARHLGILGGSNGGLLVGAALTQHPERYRAAVALVGIFDSLRHETSTNGQFNVAEYGTVADPEDFRALLAYSPYHRVKAGTEYPAVLLTAGENDGRVPAWHARKFAAALQESGTRAPVLLVSRGDVGHGVGASLAEVIDDNATAFAFLYHHLGVDLVALRTGPLGPP